MRILVAMDKFKGTATAADACAAVRRGLGAARADLVVRDLPMADGGDGTLQALIHAGFVAEDVVVRDALGAPLDSTIAHQDGVWLIEVATVCGLGGRRPTTDEAERADSSGVGDAVRHALDAGATAVHVALGGSATSDGGAGMLRQLGVRLLDRAGAPLPRGGAALTDLHRIDWSGLDPRLTSVALTGLCDVDTPLLGTDGAAAGFGPQKGADAGAVARLEAGLARFAEVATHDRPPSGAVDPRHPGAGAAGGLGWGLLLLGAELRSGGEAVAEVMGLDAEIARSDAVITGEGRLDAQSLAGKVPSVVVRMAARHGVPVYAIVGQDQLGERARAAGLAGVLSLGDLAPGTEHDPALTLLTLEQAGAHLALPLLRTADPARTH
ncbi:glycerate kinase [Microbacterium sp. p3-SID336]|uniref:glycerate kinase n=1 Tax=Microbacterium sp. p3-SID336 TaxID=2916212 RepID=UPI0021A6F342|nr:glycerate kinase [Microbacterium sp. p3-SID336]MCT1478676.1 glycerate kinase [Microbacterium sp. p3-SID336]